MDFFFAKTYQKSKILSEVLRTRIKKLDDYAYPKVQYLIFRVGELDWRCTSYPFRHEKVLHFAEGKNLHTQHGPDVFLPNCNS